MKKTDCKHFRVALAHEISHIASAIDPLSSGRIPLNVEFTVSPNLVWVTKSGSIQQDWLAVQMIDADDNAYHLSPRTMHGITFFEGKLKRVVDQPYQDKSLVDFIKTSPKVKIVSYESIQTDKYGSDPVTQTARDMAKFAIIPVA